MKNLQLPLKRKWFEMTKSGEKTEDYREINQYWLKRLYAMKLRDRNTLELESDEKVYTTISQNKDIIMKAHKPIAFTQTTLTLGYPKSTDTDRIIRFEHKGIKIGEGRPEWGAEKGKLYFIIKHGKQIVL